MSVIVHTKITNKSRNPYSVLVSRDRSYRLRGGETVILDYDLWSYLSKFSKKNIERDVSKGVLEITTKVYSDKVSMDIDKEGNVLLSKDNPEDTKKDNLLIAKPTLPPTQSTSKIGTITDKGIITAKRADALKDNFGATVVDYNADEEPETVVPDRNGMMKSAPPATGLFTNNKQNKQAVNTDSVFKGTKVEETSPTETTGQEETQTEEITNNEYNSDSSNSTEDTLASQTQTETEELKDSNQEQETLDGTKKSLLDMSEEEAKELGEEDYVNWLYTVDQTTKKYKKIVDYLGNRYPNIVFTKAFVKNYVSYADLKEALHF